MISFPSFSSDVSLSIRRSACWQAAWISEDVFVLRCRCYSDENDALVFVTAEALAHAWPRSPLQSAHATNLTFSPSRHHTRLTKGKASVSLNFYQLDKTPITHFHFHFTSLGMKASKHKFFNVVLKAGEPLKSSVYSCTEGMFEGWDGDPSLQVKLNVYWCHIFTFWFAFLFLLWFCHVFSHILIKWR